MVRKSIFIFSLLFMFVFSFGASNHAHAACEMGLWITFPEGTQLTCAQNKWLVWQGSGWSPLPTTAAPARKSGYAILEEIFLSAEKSKPAVPADLSLGAPEEVFCFDKSGSYTSMRSRVEFLLASSRGPLVPKIFDGRVVDIKIGTGVLERNDDIVPPIGVASYQGLHPVAGALRSEAHAGGELDPWDKIIDMRRAGNHIVARMHFRRNGMDPRGNKIGDFMCNW